MNWFNKARSGAKLTSVERITVYGVWKFGRFVKSLIPLVISLSVIFVIVHFIVKYW